MKAWLRLIRRFWRGLCTNWIGTAGVVLTTTSFLLFVVAELLRLLGVLTNAYVGLITYLALPALFIFGLMLVPIGWWLLKRRSKKTTRELLSDRFEEELVAPGAGGSKVIQTIALLSLVNVLFLVVGGARMLNFMDSPRFCGTACHSVMNPEWVTYQSSPHARVRCVDCHVGEGAQAAVDAKLNGMWQMISVTFDLYEKPIPTPVHNLRPARETCEKCHWPDAFYGDRLKRFVRFQNDAKSTPRYSTLSLKVGSGKGEHRGEIHWHVASKNEVRYQSRDKKRMDILWVEVKQPDGTFKRYRNSGYLGATPKTLPPVRTMDCVDCHNRATHIYEEPEDAVDKRIAKGEIDRRLPFAKARALKALTGSFAPEDAMASIDRSFRGFYREQYPKAYLTYGREIDRAVASLQKTYKRNIHPSMNIRWNSYPHHIGHRGKAGCFRCHNEKMVDTKGQAVGHSCTLCHSMLAYESNRPFKFLEPPKDGDPNCRMQVYLRKELTGEGGFDPCQVTRRAPPPPIPSIYRDGGQAKPGKASAAK